MICMWSAQQDNKNHKDYLGFKRRKLKNMIMINQELIT